MRRGAQERRRFEARVEKSAELELHDRLPLGENDKRGQAAAAAAGFSGNQSIAARCHCGGMGLGLGLLEPLASPPALVTSPEIAPPAHLSPAPSFAPPSPWARVVSDELLVVLMSSSSSRRRSRVSKSKITRKGAAATATAAAGRRRRRRRKQAARRVHLQSRRECEICEIVRLYVREREIQEDGGGGGGCCVIESGRKVVRIIASERVEGGREWDGQGGARVVGARGSVGKAGRKQVDELCRRAGAGAGAGRGRGAGIGTGIRHRGAGGLLPDGVKDSAVDRSIDPLERQREVSEM
ncbi:hypothetical protein AXG93_3235s1090 [Marchantia polymorpha subsp. ruderalis]|uniref:Uncharacterized protein n=1 Tax=Marchantia polymorpha subsp. ruderalis TaxID=1480154 RepID=A0A176WPT5_MARPO|nr:hypothetical protein AXG93_3235s1090 [Marchantia polymorpha subsp. ruderalis]